MFFKILCYLTFFSISNIFAQTQEATDNIKECVPTFQCKNGFIKTKGENLAFPRKIDDSREKEAYIPILCINECNNVSLTCCQRPPVIVHTITTKSPSNTEPPIINDVPSKHCGKQKIDSVVKKSSLDDEYPWTLALFNKTTSDDTNLIFFSGASLLGARVAITVNHKFPKGTTNPELYVVRAGEYDLTQTEEIIKTQDRVLTKIIRHPKYYHRGLINDIALLIWDTPLDMSYANINSICLPEKDDTFENLECYATGWGSTNASSSKVSDSMKVLDLKVVSKAECEQTFIPVLNGFQLHKSQLCAGGIEGKDTCIGDGGGPLVCKKDGEDYFKLAGLVSWGVGCGQKRPSVYSNVANNIDWIRDAMINAEVEVF